MARIRALLGFSFVMLLGCDPAKDLLRRCENRVAALPKQFSADEFAETLWDSAKEDCQKLAEAESELAAKGTQYVEDIAKRRKQAEAIFQEGEAKRRKLKAEAERKERAKQEAELAVMVERARLLKQRIRPKWGAFTTAGEPDSRCVSNGKPPFMLTYEGGTYAENEQVAVSDGCVKAFYSSSNPAMKGPEDNEYCCPDPRR